MFRRDIAGGARSRAAGRARLCALAFACAWFLLGGFGHLVRTDFFVSIMPEYVPHPRLVVISTGVLEIIGAAAALSPRWRRQAGLALVAFTVCVTPVHVDMLVHQERHPEIGAPLLWLRLAFQPALAWIIWKATR